MKVSIITVSYNSAATIKDTIESVLNQTHRNIEYIIVDGLSNDGTQNIVAAYGSAISKFVSEKDNGIYDAMNKGVSMATGEIVGILNSDDLYAGNEVLSNVVRCYECNQVSVVYGNIVLVNQNDGKKVKRIWTAGEFSPAKVRSQFWVPPHPAFFVARKVYDEIGIFNPDYQLTADADFMLRVLYIHNYRFKYYNKVLVKMRAGGATGQGVKIQKALIKEYVRIAADLKIPITFYAIPLRLLVKGFQVIKAKLGM